MRINWAWWGCAVTFGLMQNVYFGWHHWPKSDAELMADGITIILIGFTFSGRRDG